ncbi:MAG: LysM peptidoglycan-binding domain-containing protein [Clostridia bacterium]|nr:LysM peptidoglycan-binding domain-containing protein [Clostridia bacterium]
MHTSTQDRPPQEKVCGYEYTVRRGDSFYLIANRLGIPLRDLLEANSDINPARLMVGDVLCIPTEEDDAPPEAPAVPETPPEAETPPVPDVSDEPEQPSAPQTPSEPEAPPEAELPGDGLPGDEDLDAPAVLPDAENTPGAVVCPQGSRYVLRPGETAADVQLRADINRYTLESANPSVNLEQLTAGQTLCVPAGNAPCPAPSTYILQAEETLESAALRLNTSLAALLRANPCLAPSDFTAGRCIFIPE